MDSELVSFVDSLPSPTRSSRVIHLEVAANELRKRPHQWAIIMQREAGAKERAYLSQVANRIKKGVSYMPHGHFEAAVRSEGDTLSLYARYVGPTA